MSSVIFLLLCYLAAGIVFITREADRHTSKNNKSDTAGTASTMPVSRHITRRIAAGTLLMLLWPAFLIEELFLVERTPMAIRTDYLN